MVGPERDANGRVIPYDDENIDSNDGLLRYFRNDQLVEDVKEPAGYRLSSAAFTPSSIPNHGMSVDLECSLLQAGLSVLAQCRGEMGAARLEAGPVRDLKLKVGKSQTDENPHHGEVWSNGKRFSKGTQNELRKLAQIIKEPAPPEK